MIPTSKGSKGTRLFVVTCRFHDFTELDWIKAGFNVKSAVFVSEPVLVVNPNSSNDASQTSSKLTAVNYAENASSDCAAS